LRIQGFDIGIDNSHFGTPKGASAVCCRMAIRCRFALLPVLPFNKWG